MNKWEVELIGKIKFVILSNSKPIARHQDEGNIIRAYVEFDDAPMPSGKTFRQEIKEIHGNNKNDLPRMILDDGKPLRWPIWAGELSKITQEEIKE